MSIGDGWETVGQKPKGESYWMYDVEGGWV